MPDKSEVLRRWYAVGTDTWNQEREGRRNASASAGNVFNRGNKLYSYGTHFELGRIIPSADGHLAILNGDKYSVTTSRHQSETLGKVSKCLPYIILPFSAVTRAGIDLDSVVALHVKEDRWEYVDRSSAKREDVPLYQREHILAGGDGLYHWSTSVHILGESVFSAEVRTKTFVPCEHGEDCQDCPVRTGIGRRGREVFATARRFFVSGFDDTAAGQPLYFLAQLPGRAKTFEDAILSLAPREVLHRKAEAEYVRQGDIFAVSDPITTRQLRRRGATILKRNGIVDVSGDVVVQVAPPAPLIHGMNHKATETAVMPDGKLYVRGCLYHVPGGWRRPEHRRIRLPAGWNRVYRNRVPLDASGQPRAWTIAGNVD
jgi:hypothetical protein